MNEQRTSHWLLWTIGLFAAVFLVLRLELPGGSAWDAPQLLAVLNISAFVATSLVVAWLAFNAFIDEGSTTLLLSGCGILLFGFGNAMSPVLLVVANANAGVTSHNLSAVTAGILLLASAVLDVSVGHTRRSRYVIASCSYAAIAVCAATVGTLAYAGALPAFVQNGRYTSIRQTTLAVAILLFLAAATHIWLIAHRLKLRFLESLAFGLALAAAGLAAVSVTTLGTALSWTGRLAQSGGLVLVFIGYVQAGQWPGTRMTTARTIALSFRQLQRALEEAENKAAELIKHAPAAIFEVDLHTGRFITANEGLSDISGYSAVELLAIKPADLVEESARAHVLSWAKGFQTGVSPDSIDIDVRAKDGRRITVSVKARLSSSGDGSARLFVIAHDVTERVRAERAAALAAKRLELALHVGGMGTWDWDIGTENVVWDNEYYRMLGYELGEVGPSPEAFLHKVHPGDVEAVRHAILEAMDRGGDFSAEFRACPQPGAVRWMQMWGFVEHDGNGSAVRSYGVVQDVTARKQREITADESRRVLASAEHVGRTGSWRWNIQTGELDWSEGMYSLYGVSLMDFVPTMDAFSDLVHPDDRQKIVQATIEASKGGSISFDFRIIRPDGAERILSIKGEVVEYDESGRPLVMLGVNQDVTERRREQAALRESEALERQARVSAEALLETATALASGVTADDVLETVCQLALSMTEHSRATIALAEDDTAWLYVSVSKGLDPIPANTPLLTSELTSAGELGATARRARLVDYESMGSAAPIFRDVYRSRLACVVPLTYRSEVLGFLVVDDSKDRVDFPPTQRELLEGLAAQAAVALTNAKLYETERQSVVLTTVLAQLKASLLMRGEAEGALELAVERSLLALESGSGAVISYVDDALTFEHYSDDAGLLGMEETAELVNALVRSCVEAGGPTEMCAGSRPVTGGAVLRMAVGLADDGVGRVGVVFVRETRAFSPTELQFVADCADGLAFASREQRLRGEREWLATSRQEWLSGLSHDLRTPLSSIRGYAQLLADDFATAPEEVQRQAGIILEQAARLQSLIADMLLTFQIKEGALPVTLERLEVREVLERVEFGVTTDPRARGRHLEIDCDPAGHMISADFRLLERAIQNVAINALSHNPEGTHVRLCARRSDGAEEITISDDGRGMNDEQLRKIWVRYERATGMGSDTDGVGLGVSISRQLVESMGGTISISSTEGLGTTVTMCFAALEEVAETPGPVPSAQTREARSA